MAEKEKRRIVILGGGPGGISSGIQLQRYGLEPLLLERRELGGLLWNANLVENYPGFPQGVSGEKLIGLMKKQVERLGVEVRREEALRVELEEGGFAIHTNEREYSAEYLIVASGTKAKLPALDIPEGARGRVFSEVWPLSGVEGKKIAILGAGDAAFDYGLNLAKKRNIVTILNRGKTVKCLPLLLERAARETGIAYRAGVRIGRIELDETAGRLRLWNEAEAIEADILLFAIGREPNLDFLSDELRRREEELVEAGRLYFVGDVKNETRRQVVIAAGDGLSAAMQIYARMKQA